MTSADVDAAVLPTLLAALRLPSIARHWKALTETANREGWPAAKLLTALFEIEVADRGARRVQRHREQNPSLPAGKPSPPSISMLRRVAQSSNFLSLGAGEDWIENGDNLLLFGQSGTGKSRLWPRSASALIDAANGALSRGPSISFKSFKQRGAICPCRRPRQAR